MEMRRHWPPCTFALLKFAWKLKGAWQPYDHHGSEQDYWRGPDGAAIGSAAIVLR